MSETRTISAERRAKFVEEVRGAASQIFGLLEYFNTEMFNLIEAGEGLNHSHTHELMTYAQEKLHKEIENKIGEYENQNIPVRWRRGDVRFSMPHFLMGKLVAEGVSSTIKRFPLMNVLPLGTSPFTAFLKTTNEYDKLVRSELRAGNFKATNGNVRDYAKCRAVAAAFVATAFEALAYDVHAPITNELNRNHAIEVAHIECGRALGLRL